MNLTFFAFDNAIWNPRAGKMNWGNHGGWCLELKLLGFTFIIARGGR